MGLFGGIEDLLLDMLLSAAKRYGRSQQKQLVLYLGKRGWVASDGSISVPTEKVAKFLRDCFGAVIAALTHGGA